MKKLCVDMDDTIANFIGDERLHLIPIVPQHVDFPEMHKEEFFLKLKPIKGAIESVREIIQSGKYDVYILSVPLYTSSHCYLEKVEWIKKHLPELSKKIILTQDKGLIRADILIDDSLSWKTVWEKNGQEFIHFNPRKDHWSQWFEIKERLLKNK